MSSTESISVNVDLVQFNFSFDVAKLVSSLIQNKHYFSSYSANNVKSTILLNITFLLNIIKQ